MNLAADPRIQAAFAPTGTMRVAINLGNPILATRAAASGALQGVSVDLAHQLAGRLALPLQLIAFDAAGQAVAAVSESRADVGFFAIDPVRGAGIAFSAAYVLIEGSYLVRAAAPIVAAEQVDRPGVRVVVGLGSAYDLYLTRALMQAQLVRAPTSPAVVDTFLAQQLEVAAGVTQQLQADAARLGGLRLLERPFMVIRQAMGMPKAALPAAQQWLGGFVEQMKASGFVAAALARHGIVGAAVAPLE